MEHLTSPKLTPGVHCLSLRHKGMYVKAHAVKVAFVTTSGIRVERTFTLSDTLRSKAVARALRLVPATATSVELVSAK